MKVFLLLALAQLLVGCATSSRQTDKLLKHHPDLPTKTKISSVPFIKQAKNHCGPSTLAMVMAYQGHEVSLNELTEQTYTKGMEGTFQTEMISSVRRQGLLALPISDLNSLTQEIAGGNPVIVFQNLGLSFYPKWHYAVAVGYNLKGPDIILHSGPEKFEKLDMRYFERSWKLAGYWGLLVLRPDQLSLTGNETTHVTAAAGLEQTGKLDQALKSYQTILTRWPQSLTALIGLGNIFYARKDYPQSIKSLEQAARHHPAAAVVWHNLAIAQGSAGKKKSARFSAKKALTLTDDLTRARFEESLKDWLK